MQDPEKEKLVEVQIPAPTADLDKDIEIKKVSVPFYENFVCSLQYIKDKTDKVPYPESLSEIPARTRQSCGLMPVYKWNSGTWDEVAMYHNENPPCDPSIEGDCKDCEGKDWQIDLEKTGFVVSEDGKKFEAKCTFKRRFSAYDAMREIKFDDTFHWMAGYNIYKSKTALWRYVYGYSYESNLSNKNSEILADAFRSNVMLSLTFALTSLSLLF